MAANYRPKIPMSYCVVQGEKFNLSRSTGGNTYQKLTKTLYEFFPFDHKIFASTSYSLQLGLFRTAIIRELPNEAGPLVSHYRKNRYNNGALVDFC